MGSKAAFLICLVGGVLMPLQAQVPRHAIEGRVTDPGGAFVPGATVEITDSGGPMRSASTDTQGRYRVGDLEPGDYTVRVRAAGFAQFSQAVSLATGPVQTVNVRLAIQNQRQEVTVSDRQSQASVDASQNAGQIVLRGDDLDSFSDDAEDLANELVMLAGPAPGPDAPQIFIDGFSGGIMPAKASIREVRMNANPFSSEYDRVGFGRIEVFTKPGSDLYHGQGSFDFGDRALTARNPFLTSPIVPNYLQEIFAGNFGGPLSKRASFFIDADRRTTDENAVANYTTLTPAFIPQQISTAVVAPSHRFSVGPRLDYAITPNQTLTVRYSLVQTNADNQGLSTQLFDLPSQAYGTGNRQQTIQVSDSGVIGSQALNDIRFQFFRNNLRQTGVSTAPELDVVGAFTAGNTFPLNLAHDNRAELLDSFTLLHGTQTIKAGVRIREEHLAQQSTSNFNGRFIFTGVGNESAIDVYAENQMLAAEGVSQAAIAAMGYGPSEFLITTGIPQAEVNLVDAGFWIQDDWVLKPNLSLNGGLRYETQSGIADHGAFGPRIGAAWAPGGGRSKSATVLRVGAGYFFDRFPANLLLNSILLDGIHQVQYKVSNPTFFPDIPDQAALTASQTGTPVRYQEDSQLRVPTLLQAAAGIERQLSHGMSASVNYTLTRGVHQFLTRDINAPLETAFNSAGKAIGPRPFGAAGDIYQYEGSGVFRENEVIASLNARVNSKLSFYGYYVYNRAMSDTDGFGTMPSNPYDLRQDYGRAAFDFHHRAFISANMTLPFGIRAAPFLFLQSGLPYNLTSGIDTNQDGNPNDDRPAFAQNLSRPTVIGEPGFGAFDTAPGTLPGSVVVPRNYLNGPGILSANLRISRSWSFGESGRGGGNTGSDEIRGGEAIRQGGLSGSSNQSGLSGITGGVRTARRYSLTLTASFRNALNNVNPALPVGNLSSLYFGKSLTLNTYGPLPGAGPNAGAGNRHIELQIRLTF